MYGAEAGGGRGGVRVAQDACQRDVPRADSNPPCKVGGTARPDARSVRRSARWLPRVPAGPTATSVEIGV